MNRGYQKNNSSVLAQVLVRVLLIFWTIFVIYPIIWTLQTSLKSNIDLYQNVWGLPKVLHFENYVTAWTRANIGQYFFNSVYVTIIGVIISVMVATLVSYVLARFDSKICKYLTFYFLLALMIPGYTATISIYFMMERLHLINSLNGLIVYYVASSLPFSVFVMIGFYKTIPKEMDESCEMDGASYLQTFTKVLLPMSKPGILTIVIFNFIGMWNEYFFALIIIFDKSKYTIPLGLATLMNAFKWRTDWGAVFAATVIVIAPSFLVYAILQNKIESGMTMGALKG